MARVLLQVLECFSIAEIRGIPYVQAVRAEAVLWPSGDRYLFDPSSLADDDGSKVLAPSGTSPTCCNNSLRGRWIRIGGGTGPGGAGSGAGINITGAVLLGYDEDDSSGDTGFVTLTSPKLTFTTSRSTDMLLLWGGSTTANATFCIARANFLVTWGGGAGSLAKVAKAISLGAVTQQSMPLTGRRRYLAVPAGLTTVEIQVVNLGYNDMRRDIEGPMTLEAWDITP